MVVLFTVTGKMRYREDVVNRFGVRMRNSILAMLSLKDLSHSKEGIKQAIRYVSLKLKGKVKVGNINL